MKKQENFSVTKMQEDAMKKDDADDGYKIDDDDPNVHSEPE